MLGNWYVYYVPHSNPNLAKGTLKAWKAFRNGLMTYGN